MTTPVPNPAAFEKLGVFYLGRCYDAAREAVTPDLVLYDAKDLTTHAVCVGMTGSGKTGLCLALLEEAALDGVPAIAIDPKGDLGNLLLTFPDLTPGDFRPWVDEGEAQRKGLTADDLAVRTAEAWRGGLAEWGQDGERIRRLRQAVDLTIYTPGAAAGVPLAILRSLAAPPPALRADADALGERVAAAVSGLLALLGIEADPVQSREHILLSTILRDAWQAGTDFDLAGLIAAVQRPPVATIGVMDLDTFFPAKERFGLAMRINGLLASPGFAAWLEGEPLDIARLLWTPEGKPRVAILSIAHLSDAERMFFVTVLLNEVIAWMRTQSGTPSLRALLYMDEIFGYFPPTANPPSKQPMLTLLKQARAYGLGVVLATQNPVDLDYKGLANTGTWFLGRLQTERDKLRVLDGLEGASAAAGATFDRQRIERILAGLGSRVFLLHSVHEDAPVLFQTRWAMSYLRGPLTKSEIQRLTGARGAAAPAPRPATPASPATRPTAGPGAGRRPVLPVEAGEGLVLTSSRTAGDALVAALLGVADAHFVDAKAGVDVWREVAWLAPLEEGVGATVWERAQALAQPPVLGAVPGTGATFAAVPAAALNAKTYATWQKAFATHVYQAGALVLHTCPAFRLTSEPGETEQQFQIRVRQAAHEARDREVEKLRKKYGSRVQTLQNRVRRAEERVAREQSQFRAQSVQTAISVGSTVLGAVLGRKGLSMGTMGRATTAARGASRAARERGDIGRAEDEVARCRQQLADLEAEVQAEASRLAAGLDPDAAPIERRELRPRKSDIAVKRVALVWQ
jgi:hypothetical protein